MKYENFFDGLSEAVTELFAYQILTALLVTTRLFTEKEIRDLLIPRVYFEHIMLLKQLLLATTTNDEELIFLKYVLFDDLLSGKYTLLQKLNQAIPGSVKILSKMDTKKESAHQAASQFGFDLEKIINKNNKP
ncbi:hypothetical protein ACFLZ9_02260 [Patescibacteria group bacterium]